VNDDLLRESLVGLYEQAPCGYIFTLSDGTLMRVNQTFLDWTGYARDELVAAVRFQDLLTIPGQIFYENQYDPLLRMQGFVNEVAFDLVRKDRSRLSVLMNSIRRGADGGSGLIASTVFDATQRRRYEHELLLARRRAEDLAAIVTYASDAIVRTSPSGEVENWNQGAAYLFGHAAQEVVGRPLSDIFTLSDDHAENERIGRELSAGHPVRLERRVTGANGRPTDISVGITPHLGLRGELIAVSLIIRDITERVRIKAALAQRGAQLAQAHAALQEAHAQLGVKARLEGVALAARALAHLLGNDLAVPVGTVDMLRDEPSIPPVAVEALATVAEGLDAATRHIEQFQQVLRVAIKDTPVGPSLDLDRSTDRDSLST